MEDEHRPATRIVRAALLASLAAATVAACAGGGGGEGTRGFRALAKGIRGGLGQLQAPWRRTQGMWDSMGTRVTTTCVP